MTRWNCFATARAEYGRLIGVFYEAGYYAPQISVQIDGREAADISPLAPPDQIGEIAITMVPGPAFAFRAARRSRRLADGQKLPGDLCRRVNQSRSHRHFWRAHRHPALDQWRAQGHANCAPTGQTIIRRTMAAQGSALDVAITLTPGPRLRFGALRSRGQKKRARGPLICSKVAGTCVPTLERVGASERAPGDDVDRATERLRATGTFSSVAMRQAETANPDGTLDISAAVVEAPPRRIGAGLEYDTERGVKLSGFWLHRNLLGGAERFRIEGMIDGIGANVGGLDYALELDFTRPATLTPDTTFTIGLDLETESEDDFDASRIRADALLVHRYSDRLTFSGGLGLLADRADFGPGRTYSPRTKKYQLLLLPLAAT